MKNNIEESIKSILESTFVLNDWLHLNKTEYIETVTNNLLKLVNDHVLKTLEKEYGWTNTKTFNSMHRELIKDVAKIIQIELVGLPKIADIVDKYGLECPNSSNCGNKGILAEHGCNGTEEDCARTCPVLVQCEFCYCEPRSKFNLENDLKEKFASNFSA